MRSMELELGMQGGKGGGKDGNYGKRMGEEE